MIYLFSDFGATTLGASVGTTPTPGTVEIWTLAATAGSPALPQPIANQVYAATVYNSSSGDADPERVQVLGPIISGTQASVVRGLNGVTKTHAVGDNFINTIGADFMNASVVGPVALKGVLSSQTFASTGYTVLDPVTTGVSWTQGTASGNCPFTYPNPAIGKEFYILHSQPGGTAYTPTFPGNVFWAGNLAPVFSGAGGTDRIHNFSWDGVTWEADLTPGFVISPLVQVTANASTTTLSASSASTTWNVNNVAVGDLLCVSVASSNTKTTVGISGGGVTTWTLEPQQTESNLQCALMWGLVTTTGSQAVTLTMSGQANGTATWTEFKALPGTFATDGAAFGANAATTTSLAIGTANPSQDYDLLVVAAYPVGSSPAVTGCTETISGSDLFWANLDISALEAIVLTQGSAAALAVARLFKV